MPNSIYSLDTSGYWLPRQLRQVLSAEYMPLQTSTDRYVYLDEMSHPDSTLLEDQKLQLSQMTRKQFLAISLGFPAIFSGSRLSASVETAKLTPETGRGPGRGPRQSLLTVLEFVQAGHTDLEMVKSMLASDPALAQARWDWGDGDWESALEGAAHMGRVDIVNFFLSNGARIDILTAAMLGSAGTVASLVKLQPQIANTKGPHGLPMMFYVGHGGSVEMAESVAPYLDDRTAQFDRGLHTATLGNHKKLVEWLLNNGVKNPNTENFFGKTPLDAAIERKFERVAEILRQHGGRTSQK